MNFEIRNNLELIDLMPSTWEINEVKDIWLFELQFLIIATCVNSKVLKNNANQDEEILISAF